MSGLAISSTSLISFAGYLNSQTLPFYCGVGIGAIQLARVLRRTDLDDRLTCWKSFVGCGWSGFWVFVGSLADYLWLILWLIIPLRQLQHWKVNIFHYKTRLEPCSLKINIRAIISEDVKKSGESMGFYPATLYVTVLYCLDLSHPLKPTTRKVQQKPKQVIATATFRNIITSKNLVRSNFLQRKWKMHTISTTTHCSKSNFLSREHEGQTPAC